MTKKLLFRHYPGVNDDRMWEVHVVDKDTNIEDYRYCTSCMERYLRQTVNGEQQWYHVETNVRLDGVHEFLMEEFLQEHLSGKTCHVSQGESNERQRNNANH